MIFSQFVVGDRITNSVTLILYNFEGPWLTNNVRGLFYVDKGNRWSKCFVYVSLKTILFAGFLSFPKRWIFWQNKESH